MLIKGEYSIDYVFNPDCDDHEFMLKISSPGKDVWHRPLDYHTSRLLTGSTCETAYGIFSETYSTVKFYFDDDSSATVNFGNTWAEAKRSIGYLQGDQVFSILNAELERRITLVKKQRQPQKQNPMTNQNPIDLKAPYFFTEEGTSYVLYIAENFLNKCEDLGMSEELMVCQEGLDAAWGNPETSEGLTAYRYATLSYITTSHGLKSLNTVMQAIVAMVNSLEPKPSTAPNLNFVSFE